MAAQHAPPSARRGVFRTEPATCFRSYASSVSMAVRPTSFLGVEGPERFFLSLPLQTSDETCHVSRPRGGAGRWRDGVMAGDTAGRSSLSCTHVLSCPRQHRRGGPIRNGPRCAPQSTRHAEPWRRGAGRHEGAGEVKRLRLQPRHVRIIPSGPHGPAPIAHPAEIAIHIMPMALERLQTKNPHFFENR